MSEPRRVGLQLLHPAERARGARAREALGRELPDATFTEPDETGTFEAVLPGGSEEQAVWLVFDAIAAAGVDDDLVMLEHPELRHHWEHRAERPGS
jgi:hypothetical protein